MGYKNSSKKEKFIILTNTGLRTAQVIVAFVVVGIYSVIQQNSDTDVPGKISYEIAIGVISMLFGVVMGFLPFHYSYRPVALCAILDFVMVALYGVAFALVRGIYNDTLRYASRSHGLGDRPRNYIATYNKNAEQRAEDILTFGRYSYVNIAALILFLISGLMGAALIFIGRKSARNSSMSKV